MYSNYNTLEQEMPYLLPQYDVQPTYANNTGIARPTGKMSRAEKKAIKRQQKDQKKATKA